MCIKICIIIHELIKFEHCVDIFVICQMKEVNN